MKAACLKWREMLVRIKKSWSDCVAYLNNQPVPCILECHIFEEIGNNMQARTKKIETTIIQATYLA